MEASGEQQGKGRRGMRAVEGIRSVAVALGAALAILAGFLLIDPRLHPATAFTDPHTGSYGAVTDSCAGCHRSHTGKNDNVLKDAAPQSTLCFTCHDTAGTGSVYKVQAEYFVGTVPVPANDPTAGKYYQHPALAPAGAGSAHTTGQADEFAGVRNRHAECGDCHNPHKLSATLAVTTVTGWNSSGAIGGTPGVQLGTPLTWVSPTVKEYQLCVKCHSSYTLLKDDTGKAERYKSFDKASELDTTVGSYHPVSGRGKNTTVQMQNNLNGGSLWKFATTDTIRCTNCHGNRLLVGTPPVQDTPVKGAFLAPHASPNRSILTARYEDDVLGSSGSGTVTDKFALCFLCHSPVAFTGADEQQRSSVTNFSRHRLHVVEEGFLCAECHYRLHSTKSAAYAGNTTYQRLVNFAPDVLPTGSTNEVPNTSPLWTITRPATSTSPDQGNCTLTCHTERHDGWDY